MWKV